MIQSIKDARRLASALKKVLCVMAMEDRLPLDMTTFDEEIFVTVIQDEIDNDGKTEKEQAIDKIKTIIKEWGGFAISDLEFGADSPIINQISDLTILAEKFGLDTCTGVTYQNEIETDTDHFRYEDLDLDTLLDIVELADQWDVESFKTQQRIED